MVKVLVGMHHLELGGSQLNALDMAVAMRDRGHDVVVFATHPDQPGPVAQMVRQAGLPLVLAKHPLERHRTLSVRPTVLRHLTRTARNARADLVHAYEFPLALDAFFGPHLLLGVPLVYTVYGMGVPRWLPRYPALVVGTRELVDQAREFRHAEPVLIEPPVNTDTDNPAAVDGRGFRAAHGVGDHDILMVTVSRLEPDMKAGGVERSIEAVRLLDDPALRYVVVGEGPSFPGLNERAARVNAELGRTAVIMTGSQRDPRPAYAAADVALGMGGSALRAMAFAKPLIVLGILGFSKPFEPASSEEFFTGGFYGIGVGDLDARPLAEQIRTLAASASLRTRLGTFSRHTVLDRFSLKTAADRLGAVYREALASRHSVADRLLEAARTAGYRTAAEAVPESVKTWLRPLVRRGGP